MFSLFILPHSSASTHHHITFFTFQISTLRPGYIRVFSCTAKFKKKYQRNFEGAFGIIRSISNCYEFIPRFPRKQSHKHYFRSMKLKARQSSETSEKITQLGSVIFQKNEIFTNTFSGSESYPYFMKIGGLFPPLQIPPVADIQSPMNKFISQFLKAKSNIILPSTIMPFVGGGGINSCTPSKFDKVD